MNHSQYCSGFGQHHTNNPTASTRKPYSSITYNELLKLAAEPPSVQKAQAQWAIFSANSGEKARQHKYQREEGSFSCLWVDIDTDNHSIDEVKRITEELSSNYMIYSSKSSTPIKKKWRVLLPLTNQCSGAHYITYQKILNQHFEDKGIAIDKATERAGQLCYLPNKGEFYEYHIENNTTTFDTILWQAKFEQYLASDTSQKEQIKERQALSAIQTLERSQSHVESPIDAFNASVTVNDMLLICGYQKHGARFLSPNSESGSAGVTAKDGKWFSSHESDARIGNQDINGKSFGDAADLWFHYFNNGAYSPDDLAKHIQPLNPQDDAPLEEVEETLEPEPINIAFDGTLGEIQQYCYDTSLYPDTSVAGFTALSIFASICGHRYTTPTGLKTSLYCMLIMPTASGKDSQKDAARKLLKLASLSYRLTSMASSKQALHDALQNNEIGEVIRTRNFKGGDKVRRAIEQMKSLKGYPTTSYIIADEFHDHFTGLDKNPFKMGTRNLLMSVYSETHYIAPDVAMANKYYPVTKPHLNILGFSTPLSMLGALRDNASSSGFINRFLTLFINKRPAKNRALLRQAKVEPSDSLIKSLKLVGGGKTLKKPTEVKWNDGGFEKWAELDEDEIEPLKDGTENAELSGRLAEDVIKIASLFAINDNHEEPLVTDKNIAHAWLLRKSLHEQFIFASSEAGGIGASETARLEETIRGTIKKHHAKHGKPISYTRLKASCSLFKNAARRDRRDAIHSLVDSNEVEENTKGKGVSYNWVGKH